MTALENRVGKAVWSACADHDIILVHSQQRDIALAAIEAMQKDAVAWLVELTGESVPTWWGRVDNEDGVMGWSSDQAQAIRFSRTQDAQAFIDDAGWSRAVPTEHIWCDMGDAGKI